MPLGIRWPAAAAAAAALGGLAAGGVALHAVQTVFSMLLAGLMGLVAAEDLRRFRVPNALTVITALAGFAAAWMGAGPSADEGLSAVIGGAVSALLCGGALLGLREAFFRLRDVDGLGMGDVKLAAAGGIWLGWQLFAFAVLFAALGALLFVTASRLLGPWPADRRIPLAFYLAPAIWIAWFVAQLIPPL